MPSWMCIGSAQGAIQELTIAAGKEFGLKLDSHGFLYSTGKAPKTGLTKDTNKWTKVGFTTDTRFQSLDAGEDFGYLVDKEDTLWVVGKNTFGQLGLGSTEDQPKPCKIPAMNDVLRVHCGRFHAFVVLKDGRVFGSGRNDEGQLGLGHRDPVTELTELPLTNPRKIAGGSEHSLFLKENGEVWVTGDNDYGELLQGFAASTCEWEATPIQNAIDVAAGEGCSYVVTGNYSLIVSGKNGDGQLGLGNSNNQMIKKTVPGLTALGVFCNYNSAAMVITPGGELMVTGKNGSNQLGIPNAGHLSFTQVPDIHGLSEVALGFNHSLIISNKELKVAGNGLRGQLGQGDNNSHSTFE